MSDPRRSGGYARTYDRSTYPGRTSRPWRAAPYTRWGAGVGGGGCYGCSGISISGRFGSVRGAFFLGYTPFFAIPLVVPFYYDVGPSVVYERVVEQAPADYEPEASRGAAKLIVVGGGSAGGGDALTVETVGDSVRVRWIANGRAAREVKLFVADSARRELATRSASAIAPVATFEASTLSAPVAFAGVEVTFADGVTSRTVVPYRVDAPRPR